MKETNLNKMWLRLNGLGSESESEVDELEAGIEATGVGTTLNFGFGVDEKPVKYVEESLK